jgi:predicted dehydrogenase
VGEARKLVKAAARYNKKFMVAENWYFWDVARQLQRWIAQGKIGRPRLVEVNQTMRVKKDNMYYQTRWRQKPGHIGGFIVDGGVHIANVVREMFGLPKGVRSLVFQISPHLPPADTLLSVFELEKNMRGIWKYSFALPDSEGPIITVQGDQGTATLSWSQATLKRQGAKPLVFKGKENNYLSEFIHFYDVAVKRKPLAFKPRQALQDLEFMAALLKGR